MYASQTTGMDDEHTAQERLTNMINMCNKCFGNKGYIPKIVQAISRSLAQDGDDDNGHGGGDKYGDDCDDDDDDYGDGEEFKTL